MLTKLDRTFLNDFIQFEFMGHPVAAIALLSAGEDYLKTATHLRKMMELVSKEEAELMAQKLNDGARIQGVAIAKLIAEFASSMEDLGALYYAVSKKKNVFEHYANCDTSVVARFFDDILNAVENNADVISLIGLPQINDIKEKVLPDLLNDLEVSYKALQEKLAAIASMYRGIGVRKSGDLPPLYENHVFIITDIRSPGSNARQPRGGLYPSTLNKIKHRFLVIESIDELLKAKGETEITYTAYSRNPEKVLELYQGVFGVTLCMAEIAALFLILDDNGLIIEP